MIAYMAVSSSAEPTPWTRRIVTHHAANGQPAGSAEATEKRIDETETVQMPQM